MRLAWRQLVLLAVVTALVATVAVATLGSRESPPLESTASPTASMAPPTAEQAHPPVSIQRAQEVAWDDDTGVRLPVSPEHGPRRRQNGLAFGFAATETGAALAALHLVLRTSPTVGPAVFGPTVAQQVRGPNRIALEQLVTEQYQQLREQAGVREGAALPGADAEALGYRVEAYDSGLATVQIVLTSFDLRSTDRHVVLLASLQWSDGDWQLLAPPQGDWATVTRLVTHPPAGLVDFGWVG